MPRAFELAYDEYVEAGVALFGMSTDDGGTQAEFAATCGTRFPLVPDAGATTTRALGLLKHYDGHGDFADRVTLLLDSEASFDRSGRSARWPGIRKRCWRPQRR